MVWHLHGCSFNQRSDITCGDQSEIVGIHLPAGVIDVRCEDALGA